MGPLYLAFLLPVSFLIVQVSSRAVNITTSWALPQEGFPHFFRYFKESATWDHAKVICGSFHAELLTVESDERRDAARAYLKELDVLENVWCGLQRSSIEAPFVWTGGGHGPVVGDAFWQQAHPLEPERLCVAINPLYDFRWQSFPCDGPQVNSFVCQLEVPEWATGEKGCLIHSLPSLTVTYLPEPGVIELLSDCGLSGTRRIACKGGERQEELMKRLSCDREEDSHSSTQGWTTKAGHRMDTSTPPDSVNAITSLITRSSGTRHKRESGGTSTSTDTSILPNSEASPVDHEPAPEHHPPAPDWEPVFYRFPPPDPMSPLDTTTQTAEYVKEDQIEETTSSVIQHTQESSTPKIHSSASEPPAPASTSHRLTVKSWLVARNEELAQILRSTGNTPEGTSLKSLEVKETPPTEAETTQAVSAQTETAQHVEASTTGEYEVSSSTHESTSGTQAIETPPTTAAPQEPVTHIPNKDSHLPHPPLMQLREHHRVQPTTTTTVKTTLAAETTTAAEVSVERQDIFPENPLIITIEGTDLNETENNVLLQDSEAIVQLPEQEALVSGKLQVSPKTKKIFYSKDQNGKALGKSEKVVVASVSTPGPEETQSSSKKNDLGETHASDNDGFSAVIPVIVIGELDVLEMTEHVTPKTEKASTGGELEAISTTSLAITQDKEKISPQTIPVTRSEQASTDTPAQPNDTVPDRDRPVIDKSTTTSASENVTRVEDKTQVQEVDAKKVEVDATAASLTNEPKDTVTDAPTRTNTDATPTPNTEATPVPSIHPQPVPTDVQTSKFPLSASPHAQTFTTPAPSQPTPADNSAKTATPFEEIVTATELPITPTKVTAKVMPDTNAETDASPATELDALQDLPLSEESSEEAENPKRSTRGRLFQHSNPLSFYPYFLNRVLG